MAIGDNIKGADRTFLNVVIVLALATISLGLLFIFTGWEVAKAALYIVGPIAIIAVFTGVIRAWLPRDEV